jgi:acyl carrier protein
MPEVSVEELKKLLVENCVLKVKPDEITEDAPLFGPGSIGLDSLDALQMTVAIEQSFGIAITDSQVAREALQSLRTLQEWLAKQPSPSYKPSP